MTRISMTCAAVTMTLSLAQAAQPITPQPLSKQTAAVISALYAQATQA